MKKDRSHWTVKKVSFAEAEELDDEYYSSLSETQRLEMVMDLRSTLHPGVDKIEKVVSKYSLHEKEV